MPFISLLKFRDSILANWLAAPVGVGQPDATLTVGSVLYPPGGFMSIGGQTFAYMVDALSFTNTNQRWILDPKTWSWSYFDSISGMSPLGTNGIGSLNGNATIEQNGIHYLIMSYGGNVSHQAPCVAIYDGQWTTPTYGGVPIAGLTSDTPSESDQQLGAVLPVLQTLVGYQATQITFLGLYNAGDHCTVLMAVIDSGVSGTPTYVIGRFYADRFTLDPWLPVYPWAAGVNQPGTWCQAGSSYYMMLPGAPDVNGNLTFNHFCVSDDDGTTWRHQNDFIPTTNYESASCIANDHLGAASGEQGIGLCAVNETVYGYSCSILVNSGTGVYDPACSDAGFYRFDPVGNVWILLADFKNSSLGESGFACVSAGNESVGWPTGIVYAAGGAAALVTAFIIEKSSLIVVVGASCCGAENAAVAILGMGIDPLISRLSFAQTRNFILGKKQLNFFRRLGLSWR